MSARQPDEGGGQVPERDTAGVLASSEGQSVFQRSKERLCRKGLGFYHDVRKLSLCPPHMLTLSRIRKNPSLLLAALYYQRTTTRNKQTHTTELVPLTEICQ